MKVFFLVGSIVFTVLILIIGFQNFSAQMTGFQVFFTPVDLNPSLVVFGIAFLGVLAGGFYLGLVNSIMKGDDEESGGSMDLSE